jgi:aquaporin Z
VAYEQLSTFKIYFSKFMSDMNDKFPYRIFFSELIGTALLVLIGLSLVIFMFGSGTPMAEIIPNKGVRSLVTGFLFGSTGALIALSPVGKKSGAHINPIVSLGFRIIGRISLKQTIVYIMAQLIGAVIGCLPLLFWGEMGKSVAYGATLPGKGYSTIIVFLGEAATTFTMVSLLTIFLAYRKIRRFTPALFPPLYSIMVWAESAISGTSTNPARSFGPSLISGQWDRWWIYWLAPIIGTFLALLVFSYFAKRIQEARLYYFDNDRDRLFRRSTQA